MTSINVDTINQGDSTGLMKAVRPYFRLLFINASVKVLIC